MDSTVDTQPLAKRRRSTYDLLLAKQLARKAGTQSSQPIADALEGASAPDDSNVLVAFSEGELQIGALYKQDSISDELGRTTDELGRTTEQEVEDAEDQSLRQLQEAERFDAAARHRSEQLEAKFRTLQRRDSKVIDEPILTSPESITGDFSVKSGLRLATPHGSFKWLRHLPMALRRGSDSSLEGPARDAVLAVCKEHLPALMGNPDMAVKWIEKLCACLMWFEVEGPLMLSTPVAHSPSAVPAERSARRRVEEWDEAFRSLEVLLRQGLISSFVVATERFTVTIFGKGSGPWESAQSGESQRPSQDSPCAVLCPSQAEIRTLFQDNHVGFNIAKFSSKPDSASGQPNDGSSTAIAIHKNEPTATVTNGHENLTDLRELRRDGLLVVTPDEMTKVKPPSTALWFEGAWRVHGMLDVLRQYFLRAHLPSAPAASPKQLPRLISPSPFMHAAVHSAEVVKTQTAMPGAGSATTATSREKAEDERHTVELSGCFFPGQVRRLLELLRVPLPSFTCRLASEPRHSTGINAFTQLGMFRLEGVRCERRDATQAADETGDKQWKWEFEVASGAVE